ncbi:ArnT family glycosyltransferase [Luteibacter aegosomatissinici]|uniref:ArnT family glycosyltransferase n=1 Tax=Luteibacter aegosomatissinici TaxID=2911539 RepID=UPI001FF723B0|nr:glycosyltransferase family 39 protein [Luteibacter aegosomatissinici]UPG95687.1 glycosyltransferase family 39 protein [Luteibacter aegosomatissinici]
MNETRTATRRPWGEAGVLLIVAVAAFLIRIWYANTTIVEDPLRGDALQYFKYAVNLVQHHVFSGAPTNVPMPPPDTFRDPGYPALMAATGAALGWGEPFYHAMLLIQAALSAATVYFYGALARRRLSFRAGLAVAVAVALWPHLISMSGYLLSETLTGFFIGAACYTLEIALRKQRPMPGLLAGASFAGAALTNAVFAPFAPLLALFALWRMPTQRRLWLCLLVASVLPVAGWMVRNATVPGSTTATSRVAMNFVQGSWPEYHEQYAAMTIDADAAETMRTIDAEFRLVARSPAEGLRAVGGRLAAAPGHYTAWYLRKPVELWGWNIGIGQGDVYVFATTHSLLAVNPVLRATSGVFFVASPLIMLAALVGAILALLRGIRCEPMLFAVASLAGYATLVYTLLQADARYATPLRGVEVLLAASAVIAACQALKARQGKLNPREESAP